VGSLARGSRPDALNGGCPVAPRRCSPREAPAHPLLVCVQFRERSPRHHVERDVVICEVDDGPVEAVRDRRAGWTSRRVVGPEHEVIDEELRASAEEIGHSLVDGRPVGHGPSQVGREPPAGSLGIGFSVGREHQVLVVDQPWPRSPARCRLPPR